MTVNFNFKSDKETIKLLNIAGGIAGTIALFVAILICVNYYQINTTKPLETKSIDKLVQRLSEEGDESLRQEIRALDLLARKAYFTNIRQIKTGGYLLIVCILVSILCYHTAHILKGKKNQIQNAETNSSTPVSTLQYWVAGGGIVFFSIAVFIAFFTHDPLSKRLQQNIRVSNSPSPTDSQEFTETIVAKTDSTINDSTIAISIVSEKTDAVIEDTTKAAIRQNDSIRNNNKKEIAEYPTYIETFQNAPSFRGAGSNGIFNHKNTPVSWDGASTKNVLWKSPVPLKGFNAPVIWGDKVFLSGANKTERAVFCFDLQSGKLLWTGKTDNIKGSPATPPKVTDDTGLAAPSVATDGRRVYAIFGTGDIICFDLEGNRLWARNLGVPVNHYGHSSSLIAYRNMLYVQYDQRRSAKIMALNTLTGKTIWSTDRKVKISWASPILVNTGKRMELILCADPLVISYNPFSGKELWAADCLTGEVGPSAAYNDGLVFAVNEYAKMVAIKPADEPEIVWEYNEVLSDVASPVAANGVVYLAASYGSFVCLDSKTGEVLWSHDYDEGFYASPVIADGKLYLTDTSGRTYVLGVGRSHKMISQNNLGEKVFATPAFTNNKMLIRSEKNLYCIGK